MQRVNRQAEDIERAALADCHGAADEALRMSLRLDARAIGTAYVSAAGALPASAIVINRVLGLGLDAPASESTVKDLVAAYRRVGVSRYFVQIHPDAEPAELIRWLHSAGFEKARGWQKFSRGRDAVPEARTDLRIAEIGPERGSDFARIACDAFDLGNAAVPWLSRLVGRPSWHIFMSFDGDSPAGTGALFVKDRVAWTDFGATAPEFRKRGSQGALLAHRVRYALELGCERIFTCTGEAVEGDPQHSYANILRAGFKEDYVRDNYSPLSGK